MAGVVLGGSLRVLPWLSLGAEGAWASGGFAWDLMGPEPTSKNPLRLFAVVRGHVLLARHIDFSFGLMGGWSGTRWTYRTEGGEEYHPLYGGAGGGPIVGLHIFPSAALALDLETAVVSLAPSTPRGDQTAAILFRLGLSFHFPD